MPFSGPKCFWKRFALCEAFLFLGCAHGGAHCGTAAHMPKAKPMKCRWRGTTTSALLQGRGRPCHIGRAALGKTGILPVAATPGSYSFAHRRLSRRRPRGSAALPLEALPLTEPLAHRPSHEWQSDRFAIGLARSSLAVRAPCAHPRRSNGKVLVQALPKTRRPQARWGKVSDNHCPFPCRRCGSGL